MCNVSEWCRNCIQCIILALYQNVERLWIHSVFFIIIVPLFYHVCFVLHTQYILTLHCNLFYKLHEIIIMFYQIVCYSHTVLHRETHCNFKNYFHSLKLKLVSLCNANQENVWIETLFLPTELRISINIVIVKHWITRISVNELFYKEILFSSQSS